MTTIKTATREDLRGKHLTRVQDANPMQMTSRHGRRKQPKLHLQLKSRANSFKEGKYMDYSPWLFQKMNTD